MKLAKAFRDRTWGAAAVLTLAAGPLFGMLYLGRGRLAVAYGIAEAVCVAAAFAVAVSFNLIGPNPGASLGGAVYVAVAPLRIAATYHAVRLAIELSRAGGITVAWPWYARPGALIAIAVAAWLAGPVSAGLVRGFWMDPNEMMSTAMAPVIAQGDHVVVDKRAYRTVEPAIGDIVLVRDGDGIAYLRRIVARRDALFTLNGENSADRPLTVPGGAILGKVTTVFWRAASQSWQWDTPN